MKTTHKLRKSSDFGKIAPYGRMQSYWKNVKDIDISQNKIVELVEDYNLAGIEFGDWVPQNERVNYVDDIYKGLPVLCNFLGIKKSELGQDTISIAFGARGRRKAHAHFEPRTYAINLTRKKGRRSFLHEYIHALDRILYEATKDEYGENPQLLFSAYFVTDGKLFLNNSRVFEKNLQKYITETGVRGAISRLLWNLCFMVEKKDDEVIVKWTRFYANCKMQGEYWAYPWEILARSFEAYFTHSYMKDSSSSNEVFRAIAKTTDYFSGIGVITTEYPKASLVNDFKPYFEDVIKCFQWVLDSKELGKPNKSEPKFAPSSAIKNEPSGAVLRRESEKKQKPETKKQEPETKKQEPETKKQEPETKKQEEDKYNFDNMFETFKRGYNFISFSPDKRAKEDVNTYNEILQSNIDELKKFGASDDEIEKYYNTFKSKLSAYYSALSRTLSSAITGPAKFPVESNRKKQKVADKRYEELNTFLNSSMKKWASKENKEKRSTPIGEFEIAQSKVEELQKQLDTFTGINKIIRQYKKFGDERIIKELMTTFDFKEDLAKGLLKPDYAGRIGIPDYQISNTRQNLNRYKKRMLELQSKIMKGTGKSAEIYGRIDNGYVQINYEMDRVQIVFDGKPSSDIIQKMKKNGWRWSPFNKQWQRKYTDQAIYDIKRLFPEFKKEEENKSVEKTETKSVIKSETKTETKTESKKEEFVGAGVSNLFQYLAQTRSGAKFTKMWGIKPNELVSELNNYWENKTASSINDLMDIGNNEIDKLTELDKKALIRDFIEYCMLATQKIHTHSIDKSVVSLLKKMKSRNWEYYNDIDSYTGQRVWPYVRPSQTVEINQQKNAKLSLEGLRYVIDRIASDDQYRPAMQGVYYDLNQSRVFMTDGYKLIVLPTKYIDNSIIEKLHANSATMVGVKNRKNFEKEDSKYPDVWPVLNQFENDGKFAFRVVVDEEIEKCKQLLHLKKFSGELTQKRSFIKIDENGYYFCCNFLYLKDVMETFKKLGKSQVNVLRIGNYSDKAHLFEADDIQIILMPLRMNIREVASFDPKLYDFQNTTANDTNILPIFSNSNASIDEINQKLIAYTEKLDSGRGLSDLNEKSDPKLFDNVLEVQETKSTEFLGDDITEPSLEVNSKYDLPQPKINNNAEVVTVQQMRKNKIKPMQLPSKYKSLLGNVPNNFRMLLWGAPGHGKSSLALTIGNDIGRKCKVLFVSAEESVQSATLQNRIKRFRANSRNLMFNDTTNPAIIESIIAKLNPKFIIIDSVNVIQGKVEAIIDLMLKYPDIGFIVIAQATKDHKRYSGLGSLAHAVDIVVNVKSGMATAEKNRYASLGSMPVKGITI